MGPRRRLHRWVYTGPHASRTSGTCTMPRGVPHPQTGKALGPYTERCGCGGVTGICGTPQGASKWRSHFRTKKHMAWDPIFKHLFQVEGE